MKYTFKSYYYLLICILYLFCTLNTNAHDCLNQFHNRGCTFGTKTPYRYVANYNDSRFNYEGCIEKKIWMVIRHGTRYPKRKHIRALLEHLPRLRKIILQNYEDNKSQITKELAVAFYNWTTDISEEFDLQLGTEGETEMFDLATRMKKRFPSLFPGNYTESNYDIHYTPTSRTQQSAKHFRFGLFGNHEINQTEYRTTDKKSLILRFYKYCERWQTEINHNPEAYKEKTAFLKSKIVYEMLKNISNNIGFRVFYEDVRLIRMMCVYETALNKSINSPWCDIFSYDQLKILEYAEDMGYYWIDGYGHKLTYEQACPALTDMFNFFQSNTSRLTTLYFTHSGTVLKLLALLNIAKDEVPLTHDSFYLLRDDRNWRVSLIDSFATNLAFILYDCINDGQSILTMHQERVVYLPGCPRNRPCPLEIMKELYIDNDEECNFVTMCSCHDKTEL